MHIQEIKEKATPVLRTNDIARAGVFGSSARDEATSESDIDFLVRFTKPKGFFELVRLERELSEALQKKVDLVTEQAISPYIRDRVLADLKIIYEG